MNFQQITTVVLAANDTRHNEFLKMYLVMAMLSFIPTWSLAAYFSHNLIFDGLVYDTTLVLTSPILFWFLGQGQNFSLTSWLGVALTVAGLFMVRYSTLH